VPGTERHSLSRHSEPLWDLEQETIEFVLASATSTCPATCQGLTSNRVTVGPVSDCLFWFLIAEKGYEFFLLALRRVLWEHSVAIILGIFHPSMYEPPTDCGFRGMVINDSRTILPAQIHDAGVPMPYHGSRQQQEVRRSFGQFLSTCWVSA
jgi:hypothetical protein